MSVSDPRERLLRRRLRQRDLPEPSWQAPLPWRPNLPNRLDGLYAQHKLILESDGRRWHMRVDAMKADRQRDREALLHGYTVVRYLYEELKDEPQKLWDELPVLLGRTRAA
jgi:very-short-patch-repair endonuclease